MNYQTLAAKTLDKLATEYQRFVWSSLEGESKAFVHLELDEGICYVTFAPLWEDKALSLVKSHMYYHLYLRQTPLGVKRVFSAETLYDPDTRRVMGVYCVEATAQYLDELLNDDYKIEFTYEVIQ